MRLSVVLPLLNEAENLKPLHARLAAALNGIGCDYELIFVNDGSTDSSLRELQRLAASDPHVKFLSLTRNFGHEIASTAGLDVADGDAVVLMDADLQDPPELIKQLIEPWLSHGYDVVFARRTARLAENWLKRSAAFLFYRIMRRVSSLDLPLDTGDFRLMDRRVVHAFRQFPESQRFVRGLVTWMGFRQTAVEFERQARHAGEGKYTAWQLIKLAGDALLGFSVAPLRLSTTLGLLSITGAMVGGAAAIARQWMGGVEVAGSTVTQLCLIGFGGVQLVAIGILGEYVGRVHRDTLNRPLYLIDQDHGWGESDSRLHRSRRTRPTSRATASPFHGQPAA
jgi:glycosyltransferase involved in cell wall biosynthesis